MKLRIRRRTTPFRSLFRGIENHAPLSGRGFDDHARSNLAEMENGQQRAGHTPAQNNDDLLEVVGAYLDERWMAEAIFVAQSNELLVERADRAVRRLFFSCML